MIFKRLNYIILLFALSFFHNTKVNSDELTIYFVDIQKIISQSNVGKKIQKSINKTIEKENKKFIKIENDLKKEQEDILNKKNIISKEELDKKINDFQVNLQKVRSERNKFNQTINKKNIETTNKMVNEINKILTTYAAENSISLVLQKKNIIIGKSELDITDLILKKFNDQIKSIN